MEKEGKSRYGGWDGEGEDVGRRLEMGSTGVEVPGCRRADRRVLEPRLAQRGAGERAAYGPGILGAASPPRLCLDGLP